MTTTVIVVCLLFVCAIAGYFLIPKIVVKQRVSQARQLQLDGIPLARALLLACLSEQNVFLDTIYLHKNKQSGLCYQVPIHAMALTRGGIVIFQYIQTPELLVTTDTHQWAVKNGYVTSSVPSPFIQLEYQARTILSIMNQIQMNEVPVHAYVVLLNSHTQVLQGREDVIYAKDIPSVIEKFNRSKLISYFQLRKMAQLLETYQFTPKPQENHA